MQVHVTSFVFAALLIASMESKPLWPSVRSDDHRYLSTPINVDRGFLQYHDSPYYVYNVHSEVNAAPIIAHGKLAASHLPVYSFYYGTPTYDFRLPLNPVYPLLPAPHPGDQPSTVGAKPIDEDDDGIEKLETKIEGGKKEGK